MYGNAATAHYLVHFSTRTNFPQRRSHVSGLGVRGRLPQQSAGDYLLRPCKQRLYGIIAIATLIIMDQPSRLRGVQGAIEQRRLDALMVTNLPNIRYLSGFTGSAGVLVVTAREQVLLTDGRYTEQARQEVEGAEVKIKIKIVKK